MVIKRCTCSPAPLNWITADTRYTTINIRPVDSKSTHNGDEEHAYFTSNGGPFFSPLLSRCAPRSCQDFTTTTSLNTLRWYGFTQQLFLPEFPLFTDECTLIYDRSDYCSFRTYQCLLMLFFFSSYIFSKISFRNFIWEITLRTSCKEIYL